MFFVSEKRFCLYSFVLLGTCVSVLSGCKSIEEKEDPAYVARVMVEETLPNADPRCKCDTSKGVFLHNYDTVNTRLTRVVMTNRLPHLPPLVNKPDDYLVPPGAGESGIEPTHLGCTISANGSEKKCEQTNSWRKTSESVIRSAAAVPGVNLPEETFFTNNAQTCYQLCENDSNCYILGVQAGKKFALPYLALLDSANNNSTIKKVDIMKKYGIEPSEDKCNRGDVEFLTETKTVSNKGDNGCEIKLWDYDNTTLTSNMVAYIPKELTASSTPPNKVLPESQIRATDQILTFEDMNDGPAFGFLTSSGADIDHPLTNLYAGTVRSVSRLGDKLYFANSNGCMSIFLK